MADAKNIEVPKEPPSFPRATNFRSGSVTAKGKKPGFDESEGLWIGG